MQADLFSAAPMVDVSTSLFRRMARVMTKKAMLYTEMIAADAVLHGREHVLAFCEEELPLTLQLGGSEAGKLAAAARTAERRGFSALNLNAGCPSDKVQQGSFGAVLMKDPDHLAALFAAMQEAVSIPVSVKTRIGVDELDDFEFTFRLVNTLYQAGCRHLILHARKAWLNGLSPKENRTVPPIDYERVYALKSMFPDLFITINGEIKTIEQCRQQLQHVDGVMLGRALIDDPYLLARVDHDIFGSPEAPRSRAETFADLCALADQICAEGHALHHLAQHLLGFFTGIPGARAYRRFLSTHMTALGANGDTLREAYALIDHSRLEPREKEAENKAETGE